MQRLNLGHKDRLLPKPGLKPDGLVPSSTIQLGSVLGDETNM